MRAISAILILTAVSAIVAPGYAQPQTDGTRRALSDSGAQQSQHVGLGQSEAEPPDVNEVLIGYFGPSPTSDPQRAGMYFAACLAIEQANKEGGYNGLPFRMVQGWSDNPWKSGAAEVVRMAYVHKVWAIVGGIDGPSTHLAEQVVTKAGLTLMSPGSTDRSVNAANVPWMFSCLPGDHLLAPALARAIASRAGGKPFVLVSAVDHDSHVLTAELTKSLDQCRLVPRYHFEFKPGRKDFGLLAEKIAKTGPHVLVLIAAAEDGARLICAVRKRGYEGIILGGPQMGTQTFQENAGVGAEGVIFPLLYVPAAEPNDFECELPRLCGNRPDYLAAHTYDSVNLVIAAIHKGGLGRARIREAVRELSGWRGVTGDFEWDSLGGNSRPVWLGTVKAGRTERLCEAGTPEDLKSHFSR